LFVQLQKLGYRDREPEPMNRELSHVWPLVFQNLREEGLGRSEFAKTLAWPLNELKALVFQLVLSDEEGGQAIRRSVEPTPPQRGAMRLVQ
jgi:hypothetical protein